MTDSGFSSARRTIGVIRPRGSTRRHRHRLCECRTMLASVQEDVGVGHIPQRESHRLDDEVVDRQLVGGFVVGNGRCLIELLAQRQQRIEFAVDRQVEMREPIVWIRPAAWRSSCAYCRAESARRSLPRTASGSGHPTERAGAASAAAAAAAGAGLPTPAATAASTSLRMIRPCGPLPVSAARSRPAFAARRRARGDEKIRLPSAAEDGCGAAGGGGGATAAGAAGCWRSSWLRCRSRSRSAATGGRSGCDILTLSGKNGDRGIHFDPLGAFRHQDLGNGALVDAPPLPWWPCRFLFRRSRRPGATLSPSLTSHLARLPSSMVGESAGMVISIGMVRASPQARVGDSF